MRRDMKKMMRWKDEEEDEVELTESKLPLKQKNKFLTETCYLFCCHRHNSKFSKLQADIDS